MAVTLIAALLAGTTGLVFALGGTKFPYVHAFYIPILAGAFYFGIPGGAVTALIAGVCLGPFMPLDADTGTAQPCLNWILRMGIFAGIGSLAGAICSALVGQLQSARNHGCYDALTRLPNRALLEKHLDDKIAACSAASRSFALINLRLARYRTTASTLGHEYADALVIEAARRLNEAIPGPAILYHMGAGAFAAIISDCSHEDVADMSRTLLDMLNQRVVIDTIPILPGGQVGIACYPHHGESSLALLRASASALEEATTARQPHAIYDEKKDCEQRTAARLLPDLQVALAAADQLTLEFQPKVDLRSAECVGVEALVRWTHPELGRIPPGQFIPLAEETALIKPLTERVLDVALSQASLWKRDGIDLPVAVNVSIRNLEDAGFPAAVDNLLRFHGIHASQLELEITETALAGMPQMVIGALNELRGLGATIALDDFGAGHCSLAYLRDLPTDTLKLDRSFMHSLIFDRKTQLIVAAAINAAQGLGFKVLAEGIEERPVFDRLREMSCDQGQGYFIGRPMPDHDLRLWLSVRRIRRTHAMRADSNYNYARKEA